MSKPRAFVLMPFDDEFDSVFDELICPSLKAAGFDVTRADLSINQQQILKDIVNGIAEAELVVADVTGLNGNVMYELGLAHAMGRRTVIITRDIQELPFDLRTYRANEYSTHFSEAPKLTSRLTEIAKGVLDRTAEFSNPVQDFAPEFLGRREVVSIAPAKASGGAISTSDDPDSDRDEDLGILDFAIQLSESAAEIEVITGEISTATENIGDKITARTKQLELANKNLGAKAAPVLRNLMRETAGDFDTFSTALEAQNPLLQKALDKMAQSANGLARNRSVATDQERAKLQEEISSLEDAEQSFEDTQRAIEGFATQIAAIPPMEKTLNAATRRNVRAVTATAEAIGIGQAEIARARGLLQERLDG